jgi:hypothetical protein
VNPIFIVAATVLLAGQGRKKRRSKGIGTQKQPGKPKARAPKAKRAKRPGNGRLPMPWTNFPWEPDRVTEVGVELLAKGEHDPERLTLAVAKTVYPVHPITGQPFSWPPAEGERVDFGARMTWDRIRLRVNTLVAADEERQADAATAINHVQESTAADVGNETCEDPEPETEADKDEEEAEKQAEEETDGEAPAEPQSPRIGRMAAPAMAEVLPMVLPSRPALTLKGRQRRRNGPKFDPGAFLPADNAIRHGVMHQVQPGETVHGIARAVLEAAGLTQPTEEQVAHYVSLIVCSPANGLPTQWDDEHDVPGSTPYPWGADRPELWLPRLNAKKLDEQGLVTTHGVTWSDGTSGITPPPELIAWRLHA